MSKFVPVVISVLLGMASLSTASAHRDGLQTREGAPQILNSEIQNFDNRGQTFLQTLLQIAGDFGIPMGIEQVTPEAGSRAVVVRLEHGTIADLLKLCVAQLPGYTWTVQDGAIDIFGQKEWADASNLFNLPLRSFIVRDATLNDANDHLRELVNSATARHRDGGPLRGPLGMGGDSPGVGALGDKRVSIEIQMTTVRSVLNRIVVLSELCGQRVVWVADSPPGRPSEAKQSGLWKLVPVGKVISPPKPAGSK
jgi:hypothetical protein